MRILATTIVIAATGLATSATAAPCDGLTDVDSANTTYCSAVTYLKDKGITLGCTGTTYCPNDYVTRLQMALFLQRAGRNGPNNQLDGWTNAMGGGDYNRSGSSNYNSVGGGLRNIADGPYATAAGGYFNIVGAAYAVGAGGYGNSIQGQYAANGGGESNSASADHSVVAGGYLNSATATAATVGGGQSNVASKDRSVVAGGYGNNATGAISVVAGGEANVASGFEVAIGGGFANLASGGYATIPGGFNNTAQGAESVILGYHGITTADATGSFVFSDSTDRADQGAFGAGAANIFVAGATGGFYLYTNKDYSTGCSIGAGGGAWACTSSKDVKRDFSDIDRQAILERVVTLPVQTWRYKNEAPDIRHMGTFAQEFHTAFGLGMDDKSITLMDAEGVELAAIQGLNAKLERNNAQLENENADLRARLDRLEAAMAH